MYFLHRAIIPLYVPNVTSKWHHVGIKSGSAVLHSPSYCSMECAQMRAARAPGLLGKLFHAKLSMREIFACEAASLHPAMATKSYRAEKLGWSCPDHDYLEVAVHPKRGGGRLGST